jgi:hypothetical protein
MGKLTMADSFDMISFILILMEDRCGYLNTDGVRQGNPLLLLAEKAMDDLLLHLGAATDP